jgi:methylmalonyl-CoA/ethylmalonyl-CoA epimerase
MALVNSDYEGYAVAMPFTELPTALKELELDHVALAVNDLEAATEPYRLLGFSPAGDEIVAGQGVRVRMLEAGDSRLELLEPTGPQTPVGRFLSKQGAGIHHIALRVESLDLEMDRLKRAGASFTASGASPGHGGSRVAFLHPAWTGGVLLELIERPSSAAGE